ncbi:MAG: hypothetical protein OXR73_22230 [Myxococcales bacterium]|nr:hypothetical protein [Myxococcales bacterium]
MAGKYVTHYDVTPWTCAVEVMLAKSSVGQNGSYLLQVFDSGGTVRATRTKNLTLFQTDRVNINNLIEEQGATGIAREGLLMISDAGSDDDEFVSVLKIVGRGQEPNVGMRYIPFTRIE